MKSTIAKKIIIGACTCIALMDIKAQSTTVRNGYFPTGKYIGFDNSNGINPLFLKTNATDRMVINGNKTVGINGFLGLALTHDILIFLAYDFNQRSGIP